ncbi:stalk domain-containing protein [Paenibacillus sp. Soil724D2]|uniref:stalk domain-containing protein n=1 Tax=Paenibacillus sp. (strain Soil724D2) TaxID=1736392 RepID=UPI000712ABA5|nr:stalk domain-containing protein [Paenibacillus sp. Soil724D2]KRE48283.1 copper amine oxidase [Paenibacillus sp. Soil724D2]
MKPLKHILVSSLVAATLLGGSSTWAAGLSTDALLSSNGQILSDVSTFAGIGDFEDKNGDALSAAFRAPGSVVQLSDGSILVADTRNHLIRKISDGKVTTFAGPEVVVTKNNQGFPTGGLVDGKSSESFFNEPTGLTVDAKGNVYVADSANNAIRKVDTNGQVSTLAGNGVPGNKDGKGAEAKFNHPSDVAVAADGTLYVADSLNHVIRKIAVDGSVSTLNAAATRAIQVRPGEASFAGEFQDGSLATAKFNEPTGLVLDSKGNLFVSDTGNQRIRYIDLQAGTVTTVAGSTPELSNHTIYDKNELYAGGDFADGDALKAKFDFPKGLAVTSEGGVLISDSLNHVIRYLLNGKVSTIAGTVQTGETDGVEQAAEFYNPSDVLVTAQGNIVVADSSNNKIRRVAPYHLPGDLANNNEVKVVNDNKVISFDAKPEIQGGRTMVPVRAISETFGYEVKYVELAGKSVVQLIKGDVTVELTIGETGVVRKQAGQSDIKQVTDASPYVKQDRTYVPVRFFAEQIGLDVQWDAAHQTAILRTKSYLK